MSDFHMPDSWYDPPDEEYSDCECDCDPCVDGDCEDCANLHPLYDDYDDYYEDEDWEEEWSDD